MTASNSPETPVHTRADTAQPASLITGDRICTQCGYNLVGQPVMREPHYQLLIARCPECGQVAALQEYPLLGRWAGRMGSMLAGLWLLLLIVLWLGTALMIFGMSYATGFEAARPYGRWLRTQHESGTHGPFNAWWSAQDQAALLAQAHAELGMFGLHGDCLIILLPLMLLCFIVGIFWSVALIARGFAGLTVWACIVIGLAAAVLAIPISQLLAMDPVWPYRAAEQQLVPLLAFIALAMSFVSLLLGLLAGRPIARWLTKILLPPAMWCRVHWLWTMHGRTPPAPPRR